MKQHNLAKLTTLSILSAMLAKTLKRESKISKKERAKQREQNYIPDMYICELSVLFTKKKFFILQEECSLKHLQLSVECIS